MKSVLIIILLTCFFISFESHSQEKTKSENPFKKGLVFYLGADSSARVKFFGLGQIIGRYLELNEGTIVPGGEIEKSVFDIGITRICLGGIVNYKRVQLFYLFGNSGMGVNNGKLGNFYTYDGWISYQLIDKYLTMGIGQTLFNGVSRYSSISSVQSLTPELSFLSVPTLGLSDGIGRQFHLFATGNIKKFEYRVAIIRPFTNSLNASNVNRVYYPDLSADAPINRSFDYPTNKFGVEGYFAINILDTEDARGASRSFSYLGAKRMFNIGGGFEYIPRAAASLNERRDTVFHNTLTFALDTYLDVPLSGGGVFTGYAVLYNYDYGKNWIRKMGFMNYFSGGTTSQGAGISEYTCGTGMAFHAQLAYLFAKRFTKDEHKLQLYATYTYKNYEYLNDVSHQPGFGVNYYVMDHNAKVSLQYFPRPCYNNNLEIADYRTNLLLQFQVAF